MKKINIAVGILVSIVCLVIAFWNVKFADILLGLKKVNVLYFIPMIALIIIYCYLRAYRWKRIFKPHPEPPVKSLYSSIMIGIFINYIFPAKVGEIVRAFIIGKKEKAGTLLTFGTIIIERIFDFLALFFCLTVIFLTSAKEKQFLTGSGSTELKAAFYVTLTGFLILLVSLVLFKVFTGFFLVVIEKTVGLISKSFASKLGKWLVSFTEGMKCLDSFWNALSIFVLSVFCWGLQACIMYVGLASFSFGLGFIPAFLVMIAVILGSVIPPSPGGIGPTQLICMIVIPFYGIPKSDALSFSIVYNFVPFVVTVSIGWYYFMKESFKLNELMNLKGETE